MSTTPAAAANEPVDLYREVHKGLRVALFDLLQSAGSLDCSDSASVGNFVQLFDDVDMMLQTHHTHEDGPELGALINAHASSVLAVIQKGHDWSDEQLIELRSLVGELVAGAKSSVPMYEALQTFSIGYLEHMQVEEKQVMPALQQAVSTEALMDILMAIRGSVPPPDMCVFLRYMLPAMNPDERAMTLGGMKAGAPPEIFELFWGVAKSSLSSVEISQVATRIS